jgi:formylglycine-generating enzyme required for sulfatase activity
MLYAPSWKVVLNVNPRICLRISLFIIMLSCLACQHNEEGKKIESGEYPGQRKFFEIHNKVSIPFRWVPSGALRRAADPFDDSSSPITVEVESGFWMSETEITRNCWNAVMRPPGQAATGNRPVDSVSWHQCKEFVAKLNLWHQSDWKFDLPGQDEWEYACRAGSTSAFHGEPLEIAWLEENSSGRSHTVGCLQPNRWGLHDMHGNVAEWCADSTGYLGRERVIRGGSWDSGLYAGASFPNSDTPDLKINRVGFRIVLRPK